MHLLTLLLTLGPAPGGDHPWHRSVAEVDLRTDPPRIEVALQVDAVDFELHLRELGGRGLSLDRPDELRGVVGGYLDRCFLVRSAAGNWSELSYVGLEADLRDAWLYFEAPLPAGPGPLQLSNQMLFERNAFQENLLQVRGEDFGAALTCTREHPWAELRGLRLPEPTAFPVGWSVRLPPTPGTQPTRPRPRSVAELGPLIG